MNHEAQLRVVRTIAIVLGICTAAFIALSLPKLIPQAPYLSPVWSVLAITATFGPPPVIALLARRTPLALLRRLVGGYAVTFLVVVATFPIAMVVYPMPPGLSPWPLGITTLGSVAAALAWRGWIAWIYGAVNAALIVVVRHYASAGDNLEIALQDGMHAFVFAGGFVAVTLVSVASARALDRAAAAARDAAAEAAFAASRAREQVRLDALVHDQIMTTLFYSAQRDPAVRAAAQTQAVRALRELDTLAAPAPGTVAFDELRQRLRFERAAFSATSGAVALPADVADAVVEATAEAVRNSVRHGGDLSTCSVRLSEIEGRGIRVVVADDGRGFDPRAVPPGRLGIRLSMQGRLAAVGGTATVTSAPGSGTEVVIEWTA